MRVKIGTNINNNIIFQRMNIYNKKPLSNSNIWGNSLLKIKAYKSSKTFEVFVLLSITHSC